MDANKKIRSFSGNLFAWTPTRGVTEASTLGLPPGQAPNVIRVESGRTGCIASFLFNRFGVSGTAYYTGITHPGISLEILAD